MCRDRLQMVCLIIGLVASICQAADPATKAEKTVAERLQTTVSVEFRRTPLHAAFKAIGEQTKIERKIDGDALKFRGYTQNMPVNLKLANMPAKEVLLQLIKPFPELVVVGDEQAGTITLTTRTAAAKLGRTDLILETPVGQPADKRL